MHCVKEHLNAKCPKLGKKITAEDTVQCQKFVHFGKSPVWWGKCGCCYGYCDNFCDWWIYLANVTVLLEVSDTANCPITLSDYNPAQ